MVRQKIVTNPLDQVMEYDQKHWDLLKEKRKKALEILEPITSISPNSYLYGSLTRGDVHASSDIDLVIFDTIASYVIENQLLDCGLQILSRKIVMATPNLAIKGHVQLAEDVTISFPLVDMHERERKFYGFGGSLDFDALIRDIRVPGIDKRLVLIEPKDNGHRERSVLHMNHSELIQMGFSQRLLEERIRVLTRRDKIGRTGVFIAHSIAPEESLEGVLKQLMDRNPLLRRKILKGR